MPELNDKIARLLLFFFVVFLLIISNKPSAADFPVRKNSIFFLQIIAQIFDLVHFYHASFITAKIIFLNISWI